MHTWYYHFVVLLSTSRSLLHCPSSPKATVIHPEVFQDKPKSLLCCHIQQTRLGTSRPWGGLERQPPGTHTHAQRLKSYLPCPRWLGFSLLSVNRHHKVSRVSTEGMGRKMMVQIKKRKKYKGSVWSKLSLWMRGDFLWRGRTQKKEYTSFSIQCFFRSFLKMSHMGSTFNYFKLFFAQNLFLINTTTYNLVCFTKRIFLNNPFMLLLYI